MVGRRKAADSRGEFFGSAVLRLEILASELVLALFRPPNDNGKVTLNLTRVFKFPFKN
jgi:hypothetical protein